VTGLINVATISSGYNHSCIQYKDGALSCWGNNRDGQLGFEAPEPIIFVPE